MTAEDYLRFGMPTLSASASSVFREVREQALAHTSRGYKERILSKARPSRPESLKKYVLDNVRLITVGEFRKFLLKTSRLLKSNDLQVHAPEQLLEWSETAFTVGNKKSDLWTWIYQVLLPAGLKDPNGYVVPMPYWNKDIPPYRPTEDGGIPKNEQVKIDVRIIGSEKIHYVDIDILVWEHGKEVVNKVEQTVYMCADVEGFTLLRPSVVDNKLVYYAEPWYDTDGFMPEPLFGHLDAEHKESYIHSMFEYFDEFDSTFADNQAVRVQHAYPKVIMDQIPCPADGCKGTGKVKSKDGVIDCTTCKGSGYVQNPDVYSVLQRPARMPDETRTPAPPIEYIFPPTESLTITYEVAFDLLSKGNKTVGLDMMIDSAESGISKRHRLEDYDDMMQALAHGLMNCVVGVLESCASMLLIEDVISYTVPHSFNLQTVQELQEEFTKTHQSVRSDIYMAMVEMRTHGNAEAMKLHKLALNSSPLLVLTDDEVRMRLAAQIYTPFDVWFRDNVVRLAEGETTPAAVIEKGRQEYEGLNREA